VFSNYLAAALRNLARNRLYAAINIVGLAVAFAAVIVIALFVRNEMSFDRWLPGAERTYLLVTGAEPAGKPLASSAISPPEFAGWMKLDFPQIEETARINTTWIGVRHGEAERDEQFAWADPNLFSVLRLPALHGDLATALSRPDSIVITQKAARFYFGRDDVVGQSLQFGRDYWMTISAVLKDLPPETHLEANAVSSDISIFASGRSSHSGLLAMDTQAHCSECGLLHPGWGVYTYLRLKPGVSAAALARSIAGDFPRHKLGSSPDATGVRFFFSLVALPNLHLRPDIKDVLSLAIDSNILVALGLVGALIIVVGSINFINLMTARAARRAVEVGVRKTAGAGRGDLIIQFIGESLLYAILGMVLALALVEQVLPLLDGYLNRSITIHWGRDLDLTLAVVGLVLVVGVLAGAYPALVLSAFRPASVLKGPLTTPRGSGRVRQGLVMAQFAILIAMIVSTGVIYRQTTYALNEGMRLDKDLVYQSWNCNPTFRDAVAALPGVKDIACSSGVGLNFDGETSDVTVTTPGALKVVSDDAPVDYNFFQLFDVRPLAGRVFSKDRPWERVSADPAAPFQAPVVINQAAVRQFGFSSAAAAVGQRIVVGVGDHPGASEIIGVVPDFSVDAVRHAVPPTVYFVNPKWFGLMNIRMTGRDVPQTLKLIPELWKRYGDNAQYDIYSLDWFVQDKFADLSRQATLFALVALVALFVACLGLFGLAAFTAEQRTKEIGIRKAMGAARWDIVRLLVWSFTKPVLWANLIAWPIAFLAMSRWLSGFPNHIALSPWMFAAASAVTLAIAWLTVGGHALAVASAKPVKALRYE
jgi:putative ABC transport system permease protein